MRRRIKDDIISLQTLTVGDTNVSIFYRKPAENTIGVVTKSLSVGNYNETSNYSTEKDIDADINMMQLF